MCVCWVREETKEETRVTVWWNYKHEVDNIGVVWCVVQRLTDKINNLTISHRNQIQLIIQTQLLSMKLTTRGEYLQYV